jgi:hypothetical protein
MSRWLAVLVLATGVMVALCSRKSNDLPAAAHRTHLEPPPPQPHAVPIQSAVVQRASFFRDQLADSSGFVTNAVYKTDRQPTVRALHVPVRRSAIRIAQSGPAESEQGDVLAQLDTEESGEDDAELKKEIRSLTKEIRKLKDKFAEKELREKQREDEGWQSAAEYVRKPELDSTGQVDPTYSSTQSAASAAVSEPSSNLGVPISGSGSRAQAIPGTQQPDFGRGVVPNQQPDFGRGVVPNQQPDFGRGVVRYTESQLPAPSQSVPINPRQIAILPPGYRLEYSYFGRPIVVGDGQPVRNAPLRFAAP